MGDAKPPQTMAEIADQVRSSRRIDENTWELTLKDGSIVHVGRDGSQPEGASGTVPVMVPGYGMAAVDGENRSVAAAKVPDSLNFASPAGGRVQYDLRSIADAQRWLLDNGDFIVRLSHGMADIKALLDGRVSDGSSSLGEFPEAKALKTKHDELYSSFHSGLRGVAEDLYDAHDALGKVVENYRTTEERNRMTGEQMQQVLNEQKNSQHDLEARR